MAADSEDSRVLLPVCFRSSLIYGICGGITSGLAYFLFTSKLRSAPHVAMASYVCITAGAWVTCRYRTFKAEVEQRQFRLAVQQKLLHEGTEHDSTVTRKPVLEDAIKHNITV